MAGCARGRDRPRRPQEGLGPLTLTAGQLELLVAAGKLTEHPTGEALTEEGRLGHQFHLILEGAAVVERGAKKIADLGRGDFVGEIALLGGGRSTATVRCTAPTKCLTIRRQQFWEVLEKEPAIALRILEVVCRRLEGEFVPSPTLNFERA